MSDGSDSNDTKKKKPPNLDIPKEEKSDESSGLSASSGGSVSQKSPKPDCITADIKPKSPKLDPSPKTPRKRSPRSPRAEFTKSLNRGNPKSPRLDSSPSLDKGGLTDKGDTDSTTDTTPRSPRPPSVNDSPKSRRHPDSPLHHLSSKQSQLLERHMERRGHGYHDSPHKPEHPSKAEHKQLNKADSTVSQKKIPTESNDEDKDKDKDKDKEKSHGHGHHHSHHHHHSSHKSPKRTQSERRRHSQRRSSTSSAAQSGATDHRRASSVGGHNSRRSSMRGSDRRKSISQDGRRMSYDRVSHDCVSISEACATVNGSPVHIEYYKKPSHPSGPYMSPGLSSAYKTPAAEVLIASLIILVGLVSLITSWATGIRVWMIVGVVCVGLGGMFMLLGLCWYCALARQKEENENIELKLLDSKQLLKLSRTPSVASYYSNAPQLV